MKEAVLRRISDNGKQTLGTISVVKETGQLFVCKTLELPWKDNAPQISCIPNGSYQCLFTRSSHLSQKYGRNFFTYEVMNVPNRTGIRIHAANYFSQLLGCIALGDANADINADGEVDMVHSIATIAAFQHLMEEKDFKLLIIGVGNILV